jgi:hypothetical protein
MKKTARKTNEKIKVKQNLLPFIYSPVYNLYKPGMSLNRPQKNAEPQLYPQNRQILIEFTPDNYIDSHNTEVNILITPVLPK